MGWRTRYSTAWALWVVAVEILQIGISISTISETDLIEFSDDLKEKITYFLEL